MSSIALRPERRQYLFRMAILRELSERGSYRNAVAADLVPLWRVIKPRYWPDRMWPGYSDIEIQIFDLEIEVGPIDPDLLAYRDAVASIVSDRLRLRQNGVAARWAVEAVHNHVVTDRPGGISFASFVYSREAKIQISVDEDSARVTAQDHTGREAATHELHSDGMTSFQDWQRLEDAAVDLVRQQVRLIRNSFEADYGRTGTGFDRIGRLRSDLQAVPTFVDLLLATPRNRPRLDDATRRRLSRIFALVGIDSLGKKSR